MELYRELTDLTRGLQKFIEINEEELKNNIFKKTYRDN